MDGWMLAIMMAFMGAFYIGWHFRPILFPLAIIFAAVYVLWWAVPRLFKGMGE